jgi:hypothetical protein
MRGLPGLALGVATALVVACAASPKRAMAPSQPAPGAREQAPMEPPSQDPHAQIEYYSNQIDAQRQQLGMPEAPRPMSMAPAEAAPPHAANDTTCHAGASEACSNVCRFSDSICDNAVKICKISDGLVGDEWAAGKCASARSTCADSHKRCCTCG